MVVKGYHTIAEIARASLKPEHQVRKDHREGRLRGGRKIGSTWVFTDEELEAYLCGEASHA